MHWIRNPESSVQVWGGAPVYLKEKEMKLNIEIQSAEGGDDSKMFVNDLTEMYIRLSMKMG